MNTVLTVREGSAASHQKRGWEAFTDAVVAALCARETPLVFLLWGKSAQRKARGVDLGRHRALESVHPSPLSAHRGFFGSRPFSGVNAQLAELGHEPLDWSL